VTGGFYGRYWGGGYFHGGYWPAVHYAWGYPLFLPVLPAVYATFWWGAVPFFYVNSVYYTWSPASNGYVVTDPPPAASSGGTDSSGASGSADVYAYPQNGQSEEQQANDRFECHTWARSQTGFDPTRSDNSGASGTAEDYRRAMAACLNGRGYSTG
jgi:hypothetical protein